MNRGEQLLRGSGMAPQVTLRQKPYEWGGRSGWDPAALGPMLTREQEREARHAEYARLRAGGLTVPDAARAMGLAPGSGRWYEQQRRLRTGAE